MSARLLLASLIFCLSASGGPLNLTGFLPACGSEGQFTFVSGRLQAVFSGVGVSLRAPGGTMRMKYEGAGDTGGWQPLDPLGTRVNLVRPGENCFGLGLSHTLSYPEIYPGISVRFESGDGTLKSEYRVEPGADPSQIRLRYQSNPAIEDGTLVIVSAEGAWKERPPVAWQMTSHGKQTVYSAWQVRPDGAVGFVLSEYDHGLPLVIDPTVSYSTYLSNASSYGFSAATGTAVDNQGNVYVTGWIEGSSLGVPGTASGSVDAYLIKLTPSGSIVFATYFGGSADDRAFGVALDNLGQPWICGVTSSYDLPVLRPFQALLRGYRNAFVARFSASGVLQISGYYGGSGPDAANGIAADASGNVYITGDTQSANLTLLQPAQSVSGGGQDAFVAKISPAGALLYSTYLGGSNNDHGAAIAVDASGNAYVTGGTYSRDFPTRTPFQSALKGGGDAFVTKLAPNGSSFVYSTYLGGSSGAITSPEQGNSIAVDATGNAYVAGVSGSPDFPIAGLALQKTLLGSTAAFVTQLNPAGTGLTYSTYLGGTGQEVATGIIVDRFGSVAVTGYTSSSDFPSESPVQSVFGGVSDSFTVVLNPMASGLYFSSVWGGSGIDAANALAMDSSGNVYVAGQTSSIDFPLANQLARSHSSGLAAFLVKLTTNDASMYIHRLNYGVYGSTPDAASLASYVDSLNQGTQSRAQLALNFTQDPGYQALGFSVAGAYLGVIGRDFDYGGFQFWMTLYRSGYLASQVCSVVTSANATDCAKTALINDFMASQEFQNTYGSLSNSDFVTRVGYGNVLGRVPDAGGLAYWTGLLNTGALTRAQMLLGGFINGPEFRNRFGDRIAIQLVYAGLLLRTPTPTELTNGTNALSFGVTLSYIISGLVAGPEFISGL